MISGPRPQAARAAFGTSRTARSIGQPRPSANGAHQIAGESVIFPRSVFQMPAHFLGRGSRCQSAEAGSLAAVSFDRVPVDGERRERVLVRHLTVQHKRTRPVSRAGVTARAEQIGVRLSASSYASGGEQAPDRGARYPTAQSTQAPEPRLPSQRVPHRPNPAPASLL